MDEDTMASLIDHTNLDAGAYYDDLMQVCREAERYGFASVCVYGGDVERVRTNLSEDVAVCAVAGFPHGRTDTDIKAMEAERAVEAGADEVDVVINQGYVKEGRIMEAVEDVKAVRERVPNSTLKVICENCNLGREDKIQAYRVAEKAGADFIKTSTGFGSHGARVEDVELMAETLEEIGSRMGIKASGGVRSAEDAMKMFKASGMEPVPEKFRIGASSGTEIIDGMGEST